MKGFDFTIKSGSGKHSNLDKEYDKFLKKTIINLDEEKIHRWETYNLIMEQLLEEGKKETFEEIKYRLTDGEDPNEVMLDVITRENYSNGLIWLMKKRIEEYMSEDFFDKFY